MTGKVVDKTFNAGTKVETANVDRRDMTYLYRDGDDFVFMDANDYEQIPVPAQTVGDQARFLLENQEVQVSFNDGVPLFIELPASVELEITHTDPGLQGDRSTGGTKPATVRPAPRSRSRCSSRPATKVKVDTRDGRYLGRVSS